MFITYDAFRVNYFGDLVDCKLGLNAQSLIEIINGQIQNKLTLEGISQIVRDSDNCCRVRIDYKKHDYVTYILRPEDYDCFISNLLYLLEDVLTNRLGHIQGMSIMEELVSNYSMISYKSLEQHVPIGGLVSSAKIDEYFLSNVQLNADPEVCSS